MKILLVEPNYKNKYPPVGLMKIATYHTQRGDSVFFVKGKNEIEQDYDAIYITTLFTFHYKLSLDTIQYYETKYITRAKIFVGGIMASILDERLKVDINQDTVLLTGQLTSSLLLGMKDDINIDLLPLDYSLLYHSDYVYDTNNDYITYTTRGCTNKCKFCAVPKLEPIFMISNNLKQQVDSIKANYGEKKNLLLLDNNILSLNPVELKIIVKQIKDLGYTKDAKYTGDLEIEKLYKKYDFLYLFGKIYFDKQQQAIQEIIAFVKKYAKKANYGKKLTPILTELVTLDYGEWEVRNFILSCRKPLIHIFKEKDRRKGQLKFVDFNQGMDARQLTEEKMKILSEIPIRPFRLALDEVKTIPIYEKAVRLAAKYGVRHFSNYLLYNFKDTPEELYKRLKLNVDLADELKVYIYSFPMKYSDIHSIDRKNVGENWNSYFLANFRRILKPTLGVVGRGKSYFQNAFGKNEKEFIEILSMPYDFVTYREKFKENGFSEKWMEAFKKLDDIEKSEILNELSSSNYQLGHPIMKYYRIREKG